MSRREGRTGVNEKSQASVSGRSGGFSPQMGSNSGQRLGEPVNKRVEIQPTELGWRQKRPPGVCLSLSCHLESEGLSWQQTEVYRPECGGHC